VNAEVGNARNEQRQCSLASQMGAESSRTVLTTGVCPRQLRYGDDCKYRHTWVEKRWNWLYIINKSEDPLPYSVQSLLNLTFGSWIQSIPSNQTFKAYRVMTWI